MGKTALKCVSMGLCTAVLLCAAPLQTQADTELGAPTDGGRAPVPSHEGMSAAATKVLHQIVVARAAIHAEEPELAKRELHQALELIDYIKRREIYRHLSNGADRLAWAADRLHDIIVKIS